MKKEEHRFQFDLWMALHRPNFYNVWSVIFAMETAIAFVLFGMSFTYSRIVYVFLGFLGLSLLSLAVAAWSYRRCKEEFKREMSRRKGLKR